MTEPIAAPAAATTRALPWNTGPSGQGSAECAWCGRQIYRPAVPCSSSPIVDLDSIVTGPGMGDRCRYEAETRSSG